jgi:hypothetical protein
MSVVDLYNWYLTSNGQLHGDRCIVEARQASYIDDKMRGQCHTEITRADRNMGVNKQRFMAYVQLPAPTERRGAASHAAIAAHAVTVLTNQTWYRLLNPDRHFALRDSHLERLALVRVRQP